MHGIPFPKNWFIHIGHHKTGTTWMQQALFTKEHGFCVLNNYKEPWKDQLLRALVLGEGFEPERVRSMILERWDGKGIPVLTAERLSGHPMSGGFDQKIISERLYSAFPEAIVLIGIREADEVKGSVYKQLVREGFLAKTCWPLRRRIGRFHKCVNRISNMLYWCASTVLFIPRIGWLSCRTPNCIAALNFGFRQWKKHTEVILISN